MGTPPPPPECSYSCPSCAPSPSASYLFLRFFAVIFLRVTATHARSSHSQLTRLKIPRLCDPILPSGCRLARHRMLSGQTPNAAEPANNSLHHQHQERYNGIQGSILYTVSETKARAPRTYTSTPTPVSPPQPRLLPYPSLACRRQTPLLPYCPSLLPAPAHRVHGRQERPDVPLLAVVLRPGRQHGAVLHLRRVQVVLVLGGGFVEPLGGTRNDKTRRSQKGQAQGGTGSYKSGAVYLQNKEGGGGDKEKRTE